MKVGWDLVDGVMECSKLNQWENEITPIEIKPFSGTKSLEANEDVFRKYGRVIECNYGDSVFKDCIKSIGYCIQVFHHATVYNSRVTAYVSSNSHSIIFVVIVRIDSDDVQTYKELLSHFVNSHLAWCTIRGKLSSDKLSSDGLSVNGYHVDQQCVEVNFRLWKSLHEIVKRKRYPIPKCKHSIFTYVSSRTSGE